MGSAQNIKSGNDLQQPLSNLTDKYPHIIFGVADSGAFSNPKFLIIMTIDKAKVALGFIVAGVLTLVFGGISVLVGPTVMTNQVIKVSRGLFLFSVYEMEICMDIYENVLYIKFIIVIGLALNH